MPDGGGSTFSYYWNLHLHGDPNFLEHVHRKTGSEQNAEILEGIRSEIFSTIIVDKKTGRIRRMEEVPLKRVMAGDDLRSRFTLREVFAAVGR